MDVIDYVSIYETNRTIKYSLDLDDNDDWLRLCPKSIQELKKEPHGKPASTWTTANHDPRPHQEEKHLFQPKKKDIEFALAPKFDPLSCALE